MFFSAHFRSLSAGKKAALFAVFIALSIVVNCFSVDVGTSNKIAFTYAVCFFAGYLMGGLPAFGIAFIGDAVGYLINPVGVYWLFGVTLGLTGLLAGLVRKLPLYGRKGVFFKACIFFVLSYALITCLLNSLVNYWYVYLFIWQGKIKTVFWVWLGSRLAFQTVVFAANVGLCAAVLAVLVPTRLFGFFKQELSAPPSKKQEGEQEQAPVSKSV